MKKETPGKFPYKRGIYKDMYKERTWTMRQYAGFTSSEESNQRFQKLLENGVMGLSIAFDLPTYRVNLCVPPKPADTPRFISG